MEEGLGTLESSAPALVLLPLLVIEVSGGVRRLQLIASECLNCGLDLEVFPGWPFQRRTVSVSSRATPSLLLDEPRFWLRVERSSVEVGVRVITSIVSLLCSGSWIVDDPSMLQMVQNRVHLVLKSDSLSLCPCSTDMVVDLNLAW